VLVFAQNIRKKMKKKILARRGNLDLFPDFCKLTALWVYIASPALVASLDCA
jgi:hypothetical protein